jgi:hypothetical protein
VELEEEVSRLRMENEFLKKIVMPPQAAPGVDVNVCCSLMGSGREDGRVVRS